MFTQLPLVILLLPLLAFVVNHFPWEKTARQGDWLATGLMAAAFGLSLILLIPS
jgi:hypothetical protein